MLCPDPESLAQLASASGEDRAAVADHAAACESCRAVLVVLFESSSAGSSPESVATMPDYTSGEQAPRTVDRYRIVRRLGAGGMGVVYAARDPELGRDLAIKMLHRGAPAARLRREAQALARLSHPNVVGVHDVGEHDGQVFVAMELVDGMNLRQWLVAKHTPAEILRVLCAAARGIIAAHAAGLVHRDLKPDNIFVATGGEVLVGDFGLACDVEEEPEMTRPAAMPATELTLTGTVLGTPAYMAPEQARGAATESSDQFSFCVTAYEALFGTRPFAGKTFDELQASIAAQTIAPPPRGHGVSAGVERTLLRGLRKDPAERFPSMTALLDEIEPRARRWPYVLLGTGAVGAAIVTTLLLTRGAAAPDVDAACAPTATMIDGAWGPAKRQALKIALTAQGQLPDTLVELERRLDRYAAGWTTERRAACVAEVTQRATPPQLAGRRACLEMRKSNLEVTVASMIAGKTGDVFETWHRVTSLVPAASCAGDDAIRLSSGGAEHQALMRDLALAASTDEADLAAVAQRAEAAKDLPAVLEIELTRASDALDRSRVVLADTSLERARPIAESLDAPSTRVRALALSARSLCVQGRAAEADRFLAMATAGAARLRAAENEADLDEVFGARTECMYRRADNAPLVPLLLERITEMQGRYGREGLEEAQLRWRLGQVYLALGRPEDAKRESRAAHRIEIRFAKADEAAAATEEQLALESLQDNDLDGAVEHQRRTVEILETMGSPELLSRVTVLADFLDLADQNQAAIASYTRVIDMAPATFTAKDEDAAVAHVEALDNRGWIFARSGDVVRASADFKAANEAATRVQRPDLATSAQIGLGRTLVALGEHERAVRVLRPALAVYGKDTDRPAPRLGHAQFALAQALWETGDHPAAIALARDAEATSAAALVRVKAAPIARNFVHYSADLLASIERWRDTHR
ncbi:MAG: serine/threonine-protein kinase [Polyangiales bacterium]